MADQWYILAVLIVLVIVLIVTLARGRGAPGAGLGSTIHCGEPGSSWQCPAGMTCEGGVCVTPRNYPTGAACTADYDCTSGACARQTAAPGEPLSCCKGGAEVYAGYAYCKGMPPGSDCFADSMCDSGYCAGDWSGTHRGTCKTRPASFE